MGERRQKAGKGVGEHKVRTETLPRYRAFWGEAVISCCRRGHEHRFEATNAVDMVAVAVFAPGRTRLKVTFT